MNPPEGLHWPEKGRIGVLDSLFFGPKNGSKKWAILSRYRLFLGHRGPKMAFVGLGGQAVRQRRHLMNRAGAGYETPKGSSLPRDQARDGSGSERPLSQAYR